MKTSTFLKLTILFFSIGLTTEIATAQAILTVDNSAGSIAAYTDLQAAHDAAAAGDILYVQASQTNYGSLIITKSISIVGRSHSEYNKVSTVGHISIASSDVIIKGLNIASIVSAPGGPAPYERIEIYENKVASTFALGNSVTDAVDTVLIQGNQLERFNQLINATNVLVVNNIFTGQYPIVVSYTPSILVTNNIFRFNNTVYLTNYGVGSVNISNNMFLSNSGADLDISLRRGAFQLRNNLFYNYNTDFSQNLIAEVNGSFTETNSLFDTNPQFTNVDPINVTSVSGTSTLNFASNNDDLTLQPGSPALDGGTDSSEIGIFNIFNYSYYGNPRAIPALDITNYDATVPKNGTINVTINAKAH